MNACPVSVGAPRVPSMSGNVARSWDAEYAAGRYREDAPVGFVDDIIAAAADHQVRRGLYIGCGNGRNLVPLLDAGLDLVGLDVSGQAITQLRRLRPDRAGSLVRGDLSALPDASRYELVIGIQVFQHGTRAGAHRHLLDAAERVDTGGLLCVRVNATGTDVAHDHEMLERGDDGGFTVRYLSGPKVGLNMHFFAQSELRELIAPGFTEVLPLRVHSTKRQAGAGQWSQWEGIWRRTPRPRLQDSFARLR
jgi:trans-aconitate methyltransferase